MAAPYGITLKPGQVLVTPVKSDDIAVNSPFILSGIIEQAYCKQMAYSVGQSVSFFNKGATPFTRSGINYVLVDQKDIYFKVDYAP